MQRYGKYIKFSIYLLVIVLINVAGANLFFRFDLTRDGIYSLSPISKKVVSTLTQPLTIKVFFTKNLPAPYNATEQYLHDLLEEYAVQGNKFFNYSFYNVDPDAQDAATKGDKIREMAESYGIMPIQIQDIEKDEVKFKKAYMGLVIIHGDMIEKIPTLTSTDQIEYELTTAILKLNNKISVMNGMKDKVKVTMFMSPSLGPIGPLMGLKSLDKLPSAVEKIVQKIASRSYGKIEFSDVTPPSGASLDELAKKYDLTLLSWPADPEKQIAAGEGVIGLLMEYHGKTRKIPLLDVIRIPLLGTTYKLEDPNSVEEAIDKGMESLIGINSDLGYLADHGTLAISPYTPNVQGNDAITNFASMAEKTYSLKEISLSKEPIPPTLGTLIIARPTQKFTDYELYQIDQALMRGTNLIIYTDAFNEEMPKGNQYMGGQGPQYIPIDTGLEKLLDHYGVRIKRSIVLDENCFKQQNEQKGGEYPIYFAPIIQNQNINKSVSFLHGIKGLITLFASPLELNENQLKKNGITAIKLLSSSKNSWEMKDNITLNPMLLTPPQRADSERSYALAYLLEGKFDSYFDGKPLPELKKEDKTPKGPADSSDASDSKASAPLHEGSAKSPSETVTATGAFIAKGKEAKIFLMASSSMLRDNVIGQKYDTMNAAFVMNIIDSFNGRDGIAAMRSKKQSYNPLIETSVSVKTFIKAFMLMGLPILIALLGLFVWGLRIQRKKAIRRVFAKA